MTGVITVHALLVAALAVGPWRSAGHSRSLRWVEPQLIASAAVVDDQVIRLWRTLRDRQLGVSSLV
jgi:hypothetical protein